MSEMFLRKRDIALCEVMDTVTAAYVVPPLPSRRRASTVDRFGTAKARRRWERFKPRAIPINASLSTFRAFSFRFNVGMDECL